MAIDRGKYQDFCTTIREATKAEAVVVVVAGGTRGSGYSLQVAVCEDPEEERTTGIVIAAILRSMAQEIEDDLNESRNKGGNGP